MTAYFPTSNRKSFRFRIENHFGRETLKENDVLVVRITPLSVGQSTNINGLRQVGTVAGGASEAVITESYTAQFGTPAVGDKVQVQIYAINTLSGYASARQTTVTNIAEESAGS